MCQAEIDTRLAEPELFRRCTEVILAGNAAFSEVYGSVFHHIELSEPAGVRAYKSAAEQGERVVAANTALGLAGGAAPRRRCPSCAAARRGIQLIQDRVKR